MNDQDIINRLNSLPYNANYMSVFQQQKSAVKKEGKPKKKANLLQSLLPSIGGTGGAAAGAATGAAVGSVVPGIGTAIGGLAGALIGGGLGSAGGQVAKNAMTDESLGKDIVKEGLIGGAFSLPGLGVIRGGKAAVTATRAGGGALKAGAEATLGRSTGQAAGAGALQNTATNLQRNASNTVKVADSFTQEKDILDTLNRVGLKGSAANKYRGVDTKIGDISKSIDNTLSTIKTSAPRAQVIGTLKNSTLDAIPSDVTFTRELDRSIERLAKSGAGDVTPQELFGFKKDLGNRLGGAFRKMERGVPLNAKEEVDMALWKSLDNEISRLAPEVKQMTLDQSKLITARPGLQSGSEKTVGVPILGLKSKTLASGVQGAQDATGRALQGAGNIGSSITNPMSLPRIGARQVIGGGLTSALLSEPSQEESAQPITEVDINEAAAQIQAQTVPQAQQDGIFDPAVIQANVQQILANGGDMDDAAKYVGLAQALAELSAGPQQKPLSAEASKVVANANSGLTSLDQLEAIMQQDPSVRTKSVLPGRSMFGGLGASVLGTSSYDTAAKNIADVITRLRTGAALTESEEAFYKSQLPQAFDPPETVQQKLAMFRNLFNEIGNRTGTAGTDTQALLS